MKVLVLVSEQYVYESCITNVVGVFHEGDFHRFIELIKSELPYNVVKVFNEKHMKFDKLKVDFLKITSALNCKENRR